MYSVKKITLGLSCVAAIYLQCASAAPADSTIDSRAEMVKDAFMHAWGGYSSYAYGHDELQPITNGTTDSR
jgi:mannosyl-oligosaccharide alpha-1,2-mannosidase